MTLAPPLGLELLPLEGETARLLDRRIGLAITIPGHPRLLPASAQAGVLEPAYEVQIVLEDVPVSLRYRHNELPEGAQPEGAMLVDLYAANRSSRANRSRAQPAPPGQCRVWGVDTAASTIYELAAPDADGTGDDMEEALLLVRGRMQVMITKRFARARMPWVAWALVNSALAAGIRWDPTAALDASAPALWPTSSFLLPGVRGVVVARRLADATHLAAALAPLRDSMGSLADGFAMLLRGAEAPSHPVTPSVRDDLAAFFEDRAGNAAGSAQVTRLLLSLLADVRTAHDLRGLAVIGLHALGTEPATFASTTRDDHGAYGYLAE